MCCTILVSHLWCLLNTLEEIIFIAMSEINNLISPAVKNHVTTLLKRLNILAYTFEVTPGSLKGDNFMGIIANVNVKGKDKSGESTVLDLIVKSAPYSDLCRKKFPIRAAYEREIFVYSTVLPAFAKLQEEKRINEPFKSFSKFYNATMQDLNEALIMQNMKVKGFKLWCDRLKPVDFNHALLVIKNYGRLHALSFAIRDQKPMLFEEFSANTREKVALKETLGSHHADSMREKVQKALGVLDPIKHEKAYQKLKMFQENAVDKFCAALQHEAAGDYAVIVHGDCWINNMLFRYGDPEKPTVPTDVCLLDWQLARLGSPALDLGYFIFTCTDKDLRDAHYDDLIKEYYSTLCSFLRELGSDPDKLFPYEVLQDHLKRFCVYGLYMAIMVLYFISSDRDEIPDINSIQDEEDAKKKFSYVSKNIEKYRSRIRGVILDFVKYDYDF